MRFMPWIYRGPGFQTRSFGGTMSNAKAQAYLNEPHICYKRDYVTHDIVLKPDTFYWRLRYWINQYLAAITGWLVTPLIRWNHAVWRIQEGEEATGMNDICRFGIPVRKTDRIIRWRFPWWIRRSKKRLKVAVEHFREVL